MYKSKSIQKGNLAVKRGAHISPFTEFLMCHPSRIPRSRDPNNLKKTVAFELLEDEIIVVHARNLLIVWFYATNEVWRSTFQLLHQFEQYILQDFDKGNIDYFFQHHNTKAFSQIFRIKNFYHHVKFYKKLKHEITTLNLVATVCF